MDLEGVLCWANARFELSQHFQYHRIFQVTHLFFIPAVRGCGHVPTVYSPWHCSSDDDQQILNISFHSSNPKFPILNRFLKVDFSQGNFVPLPNALKIKNPPPEGVVLSLPLEGDEHAFAPWGGKVELPLIYILRVESFMELLLLTSLDNTDLFCSLT